MSVDGFLNGFFLGFGLIVAIGAQNAFVLRQGLLRQHVSSVVAFCSFMDAALMGVGVMGIAETLGRQSQLLQLLSIAGGLFLVLYGVLALFRACRPNALHLATHNLHQTRFSVIAQAAGFTLLNPHVYLDTVLLVGSVGAQQPTTARLSFLGGACFASALWFCLLGYGARWLVPLFERPRSWQTLDCVIAIMMFTLGCNLIAGASAIGT